MYYSNQMPEADSKSEEKSVSQKSEKSEEESKEEVSAENGSANPDESESKQEGQQKNGIFGNGLYGRHNRRMTYYDDDYLLDSALTDLDDQDYYYGDYLEELNDIQF